MRYALHDKRDSTEIPFKTITELWAHVRAHGLCAVEADVDDAASARRVLSPDYEIHDLDIDGVVRIEGRDAPRDGG